MISSSLGSHAPWFLLHSYLAHHVPAERWGNRTSVGREGPNPPAVVSLPHASLAVGAPRGTWSARFAHSRLRRVWRGWSERRTWDEGDKGMSGLGGRDGGSRGQRWRQQPDNDWLGSRNSGTMASTFLLRILSLHLGSLSRLASFSSPVASAARGRRLRDRCSYGPSSLRGAALAKRIGN